MALNILQWKDIPFRVAPNSNQIRPSGVAGTYAGCYFPFAQGANKVELLKEINVCTDNPTTYRYNDYNKIYELAIPWSSFSADCGDSIFKLQYNESSETNYPVNTWVFISPDNGKHIANPTCEVKLLGFVRSSDSFNIIEGAEDYAYFYHSGFEILEATDGLEFTDINVAPKFGGNVVEGIFVCKIPSEGNIFTFKVKSECTGVEQTLVFGRKSGQDTTVMVPAGDCTDTPTVVFKYDILCKIGVNGRSTLPSVDSTWTIESVDGGKIVHVTLTAPYRQIYNIYGTSLNSRSLCTLYMDNSSYEVNFYQEEAQILNAHNTIDIPFNRGINEAKGSCCNVFARQYILSNLEDKIKVESDAEWLNITSIISSDKDAEECCNKLRWYYIFDNFENKTTSPITANINILINDSPAGSSTINFLPRNLGMSFIPEYSNINYSVTTIKTTLKRNLYSNNDSVSFTINCITDNNITGEVLATAPVRIDDYFTQDCTITIPVNLSNIKREWIITALYKDGDYEATTEYHIYQSALELEWDPASAYMDNTGGEITTKLITNKDDSSSLVFSGDILPELIDESQSLYKITVSENTETQPKTYDTKATVLLGSSRKEAVFTVNQEAANYSIGINPNPLIIPAGDCNSNKSPNAISQIVSSYSSRLTIRTRNTSYNMSVLDYSETSINVSVDFNPTTKERVVGYIDFIYNNDVVYTLAVLQSANEFKWSCNGGCNVKFPASGGDKTVRITWNDDSISSNSIIWNTDSWLKARTINSGVNSCGEQYVDVNITVSSSFDLNERISSIKGVISGSTWSPAIQVIQEGVEKQFYFGCNAKLTIPETGISILTASDCQNSVKLYFNTPNENDVAISEAYGGLQMQVGPLIQESTGLWSRKLTFGIGANSTVKDKTWNIQARWGNDTINLVITQTGALYIKCNPTSLSFYRNGGTKFITIETKIALSDIEIINSNPDKVILTPWGNYSFNVRIGASYSKNQTYLITFRYKKNPSIQCSTKIYQIAAEEGSNFIFCNPSLINNIPVSGGEYAVEVITNLPENNIGVELVGIPSLTPGWELIRDNNDYKKARVLIPPASDCSEVKNAIVKWYAKNTGSINVSGCSTFLEQCTPTPPYLYFSPSEDKISYMGGEVTTMLLSGWDTEPSIDYSGLKGLTYTVTRTVYEKDCLDNSDCPNKYEKIWEIKIRVPETDDWQDNTYVITATGPNNIIAEYVLTQTGVPVSPAIDAEACSCNLLNTMELEAIDRYFKHLSQFGYKSYADVNRLLVLGFIEEILNSDVYFCISEEDYRVIMNTLYCIINKTCLVDFPITEVYDSLIHPILTDPDKVRITEDDLLRYSEKGCLRIEEKSI